MLSSRRVLTLLGASCVVAAAAMPVVAAAHDGGGGGRRSAHSLRGPKQICRKVGVSLNGGTHGAQPGSSYSALTETQIQELTTACNKLRAASATERLADSAALETYQQSLEPQLAELASACPRWHGHHGHGGTGSTGATGPTGSTGTTGPSTACQEARSALNAKVKANWPAYRQKRDEAETTFAAAVTEFEETVKTLLGPGSFGHRHHHHRMGAPGGPTGPTGPTGSSGPTGPTGSTGAIGEVTPAYGRHTP